MLWGWGNVVVSTAIAVGTCTTYALLVRADRPDPNLPFVCKLSLMSALLAWDMRVDPLVTGGLRFWVRLSLTLAELWVLWALLAPVLSRGAARRGTR